jgi:hypothetical protein
MQHRVVVVLPLMLRKSPSMFAQWREDCKRIGASLRYSCNMLDYLIKATSSVTFHSVDDNERVGVYEERVVDA